ncbi:MAG TPA: herpeto-tandem family RiPP [Herpetosiphonaceae bacterium]
MEHRFSTAQALSTKATLESAPIFGLSYLEEHEFDLNEVVGCFGASAVQLAAGSFTGTCPNDDADSFDEHPE